MPRYYIYDSNGKPFGNIKGYNKFSSAKGICTRYSTALWNTYDAKTVRDSKLIWEIKLENK